MYQFQYLIRIPETEQGVQEKITHENVPEIKNKQTKTTTTKNPPA